MEALLGMTVFHKDRLYKIIMDTCDHCSMRRNNGNCWGFCTRFSNCYRKMFCFEYIGEFHPRYLKEITFTSVAQKLKVYADYQQEISKYYHKPIEEVLAELSKTK